MQGVRPQNPPPMRIALALALVPVAVILSSCASHPMLAAGAPTSSPVRFNAVLQPGCLLPAPSLLAQAPTPRATLEVAIDATGQVTSADIAESTGSRELDSSLKSAVQRCRFSSAYEIDQVAFSRKELPEVRTMVVSWPVPAPEFGPHRCLTPEYPHAARRAEEQGHVTVLFRKDPMNGQIETRLRPDSPPLRTLKALTLATVSACMEHEEVRSVVPAGVWMSVTYEWRLQ